MVKIGWIGTGVMGKSMAQHLLKAGNTLFVYNRSIEKTQELVSQWAEVASPEMMAQNCDIVFTIIGTPDDVRDMYLWQNWLIAHGKKWQIFVDMTTTEPSLVLEIGKSCEEKGIEFLDAPVSGGDVWARNATLAIMVWWKQEIYDRVLPFFQLLWKNIVLEWNVWAWQHTKMCNQIAIAGSMIGMCESLLYAQKAWLDEQKVIDIISKWAAGSWSLDNLAPRILRWEFDTWFYVKHFVKDMGIALQEARSMKAVLPWLALVHQLYISIIAEGGENLWTQSLIKVLRKLNNIS